VPNSTTEVLMDLLEEQENAIRTIAVHLAVEEDLSPSELEAIMQLKQRIEEIRECLQVMIQRRSSSNSLRGRAKSLSISRA